MGSNIFEMETAFISEISSDEETFADAFFNLGKKLWYIFKPVNRNNSRWP
jgi:hypothetical protein